jgi:hypothetical protein
MQYRKTLLESLLLNSEIEEINLSGNNVGNICDCTNIIALAISKNTYLEKLDLSDNKLGFSKECFKAISKALAINRNLIEFKVAGNLLEKSSLLFKKLSKWLYLNENIKMIDLSRNNISKNKLTSKIFKVLSVHKSLIDINLSSSSGQKIKKVNELTRIIEKNKICKILDLSGNSIGQDSKSISLLSEAIYKNSSLSSLNLSNNILFYNNLELFSKAISDNKTLKALDLSNNSSSSETSFLYEFDLTIGINSFLTKEICSHKYLTKLNLSKNKIANKRMKEFFSSLAVNPTLMDLNLSWNKLGSKKRACFILANSIIRNRTLKCLNLSYNCLNEDAETLNRLKKSFCKNKFLEELDLTYLSFLNSVNNTFLNVWTGIISENTSLIKLKATYYNPVNEECNGELIKNVKSLKKNITLTEININTEKEIIDRQYFEILEFLCNASLYTNSLSTLSMPATMKILEFILVSNSMRNVELYMVNLKKYNENIWKNIIRLVESNISMTNLSLVNINFHYTEKRFIELAKTIAKNKTLKKLRIRNFFRNHKAHKKGTVEIINSLFVENKNIEEIYLDDNNIAHAANLESLNNAIGKKHLRKLSLANNKF